MPVIPQLPVLYISHLAVPPSITEPQAHLSLGQDGVIAEATSILCVCVAGGCAERSGPHARAFLEAESSSPSVPIVHRDWLLRTVFVVAVVLSALAALAWVTRDLRRVQHSEFNDGGAILENEASTLIGTRVSSSTTLHENYRACQSTTTTAVHTPTSSLGRSTKPVLQLVTQTSSILGEHGDYVSSPVENTQPVLESITTLIAQPLRKRTRGRALVVIQQPEPVGYNGFDQGRDKSQTHKLHNRRNSKVSGGRTQTLHSPSNATPTKQTNGSRAQTAPCAKTQPSSFVKSLTGLVSIQQTTVHVLAVGMSWEGVGDGSWALPGPHHDIEWLRNMFACQKNFRFRSLLDHGATLVTIRQALEEMLSVAGENDLLALYFSGHGGKHDSFELYDSASLDEVMLNDWVVKFRSTTPQTNPVYIIFDFCRPDRVKPNTELAPGINVIWACSPTESALDLRLNDPNNHLPRSCFLLSLILAIDDISEDPTAPVLERFTNRMKEFVRVIRGLHCFKAKCRLSWRYCGCESCSRGKLCTHDVHKGNLPFQVVSIGGIEGNPDLSAVVQYVASLFPLHIKRAADRVSKDHWVLYFNPSHVSANHRPLNPRNHRLGVNMGVEANTARNMTIPVNLIRF